MDVQAEANSMAAELAELDAESVRGALAFVLGKGAEHMAEQYERARKRLEDEYAKLSAGVEEPPS